MTTGYLRLASDGGAFPLLTLCKFMFITTTNFVLGSTLQAQPSVLTRFSTCWTDTVWAGLENDCIHFGNFHRQEGKRERREGDSDKHQLRRPWVHRVSSLFSPCIHGLDACYFSAIRNLLSCSITSHFQEHCQLIEEANM